MKIVSYDELSLTDKKLVDQAKAQTKSSYAPYSNFNVGAAVELANGEIVGGNNQENAAYPSGLCAERVAIFYANSQYPKVAVKTIAVAAFTKGAFMQVPITPCGSCRQVLLETETRFDSPMRIILYGTNEIFIVNNAKELLPLSFEKSSL